MSGAARGSGKGDVQLAVRPDRCRAGNGSHRAAGKGDCGGGFGRCPIVARSDDHSAQAGNSGVDLHGKGSVRGGVARGGYPEGAVWVDARGCGEVAGACQRLDLIGGKGPVPEPDVVQLSVEMPVLGVVDVPDGDGIGGAEEVAVDREYVRVELAVDVGAQLGSVVSHGEVGPFLGGKGQGSVHAGCHHGGGSYAHPDPALGSSGINHAHAEGMIGYVRSGGLADDAVVPGVVAVNPGRNGELVLSANLAVEVSEKNLVVGSIKLIGPGPAASLGRFMGGFLTGGNRPVVSAARGIRNGSSACGRCRVAVDEGDETGPKGGRLVGDPFRQDPCERSGFGAVVSARYRVHGGRGAGDVLNRDGKVADARCLARKVELKGAVRVDGGGCGQASPVRSLDDYGGWRLGRVITRADSIGDGRVVDVVVDRDGEEVPVGVADVDVSVGIEGGGSDDARTGGVAPDLAPGRVAPSGRIEGDDFTRVDVRYVEQVTVGVESGSDGIGVEPGGEIPQDVGGGGSVILKGHDPVGRRHEDGPGGRVDGRGSPDGGPSMVVGPVVRAIGVVGSCYAAYVVDYHGIVRGNRGSPEHAAGLQVGLRPVDGSRGGVDGHQVRVEENVAPARQVQGPVRRFRKATPELSVHVDGEIRQLGPVRGIAIYPASNRIPPGAA